MASFFDKAYNKFAQSATSLNRGVNKVIGKDIFQDVRPIEEPREFPPYDSFPSYDVPEPEQWTPLTGESKRFTLDGNVIEVTANLDACMRYRNEFRVSAKYYADRFAFKYQNCAQDFDSLIHYFLDLYMEGLQPMLRRAYSLLLPFGVFNADFRDFVERHIKTYRRAIESYETMAGVEIAKNQAADQMGEALGGAVRLRGGGFGLKGAMKGIAKAEVFNMGMDLLGKMVAHQNRMTPEEKANAYALFKHDVFFQEVFSDYFNSFLTTVQVLAENNVLSGISTEAGSEYKTVIENLQNPMFPQDKIATAFAALITAYPFETATYDLLQQKFGQTEEVKQIVDYFVGA